MPLPEPCPLQNDRLAAAVWSWRIDDKGQNGSYAMLANSDKRWVSDSGDKQYHFACALKREEENPLYLSDREGADWKVTAAVGKWEDGNDTCQAEFGSSYVFNVPVNGWQNEKLKSALTTAKANPDSDTNCTAPCSDRVNPPCG